MQIYKQNIQKVSHEKFKLVLFPNFFYSKLLKNRANFLAEKE